MLRWASQARGGTNVYFLFKNDEALALDYIIPFRVMHPNINVPQGGVVDPMIVNSMAGYKQHLQQMVANKRREPTSIQISPVQIGYDMIGGEASSLSPKDSISEAINELLDCLGVPA